MQGTHEDYLELFIQYGYILLFGVAYPFSALWAWINNILELPVDTFKYFFYLMMQYDALHYIGPFVLRLVTIYRRPVPMRVAHIGAWEVRNVQIPTLIMFVQAE